MARYKTTFERLNFGFDPPLRQIADVVFDTDIPCDDENLEAFEEAKRKAVIKQNPHWKNPNGPVSGVMGWSSILGGRKIERL